MKFKTILLIAVAILLVRRMALSEPPVYVSPGGSGGSVATDAIFNAAGDLVVGTGADTAARLAVPATAGMVPHYNGTTVTYLPYALPTTTGAANTILHSNGTNIVNSAFTFPTTAGANGIIPHWDGTNIVNGTIKDISGAVTGVTTLDTSGWVRIINAGTSNTPGGSLSLSIGQSTATDFALRVGTSTDYDLYLDAHYGGGWLKIMHFDRSTNNVDFSANVGIGTGSATTDSATPESLLEVQGAEATDAVIQLDADDGDDVADTWKITSRAADNALVHTNGSTTVGMIESADGMVTIGGANKIEIRKGTNGFAIGDDAGDVAGAHPNYRSVAVGEDALTAAAADASAEGNVAVGWLAQSSATTSDYGTAVGAGALRFNTTGNYNTGVGGGALGGVSDQAIAENAAVGYFSLGGLGTGGNNNTAIGAYSGRYHADGTTVLASPENSIYIGYDSRGKDNSDSNSIVIGYQAIGKGANTTVLGNSSTVGTYIEDGALYVADGLTVDATGNLEAAGDYDFTGNNIGNGPIYGSMHINGTTAVTEAMTGTTPVQIVDAEFNCGPLTATHVTCTADSGNLDIVTAGTYDIGFNMSFAISAGTEVMTCAVYKEGTALEEVAFHRTAAATYGVAGARSIVAVSANDTLTVQCNYADASTPNLLIEHMQVTAIRLGD